MTISERIDEVKQNIRKACEASGRNPDEITLVGASKTKSAEIINEALENGLDTIGENRVQELTEKYPDIKKGTHIHLIGHLQTNKVKYIIDKVELIHSVDSEHLAKEISHCAEKHGLTMNVLVQVNVSGEESKSGIAPENLDSLLEYIDTLDNIKVLGLMTIPPLDNESLEESRKIFRELKRIFETEKTNRYKNTEMKILSIGMTNDYTVAVEEGATMVRVGRAIFGDR